MGFLVRTGMMTIMAIRGLACVAAPNDNSSLVESPRVLAIASEPAEAAPGTPVKVRALLATPPGWSEVPGLHWYQCTARRPLSELGPISRVCLDEGSPEVSSAGIGIELETALHAEACRLFGPQPPLAKPGEAQGRPVDPDGTGGYFQPLVVHPDDVAVDSAVAFVRLLCGVSGVVPETSVEFTKRYQANRAPRLTALFRVGNGAQTATEDNEPIHVFRGESLTLRATWPACPQVPVCGDGWCTIDESPQSCPSDCASANPTGCEGAETYLHLDPSSNRLQTRRESLRVAWYSSAGSFEYADNGRDGDDVATDVQNTWTAPDAETVVKLWLVFRDDRGAVSWVERTVNVQL